MAEKRDEKLRDSDIVTIHMRRDQLSSLEKTAGLKKGKKLAADISDPEDNTDYGDWSDGQGQGSDSDGDPTDSASGDGDVHTED